MRLINATELEKRSDEEMFEINKYTLRLAPTVEAIPVGWLESQIDIYIDLGLNTIAKELRVLIDDWRKENESSINN